MPFVLPSPEARPGKRVRSSGEGHHLGKKGRKPYEDKPSTTPSRGSTLHPQRRCLNCRHGDGERKSCNDRDDRAPLFPTLPPPSGSSFRHQGAGTRLPSSVLTTVGNRCRTSCGSRSSGTLSVLLQQAIVCACHRSTACYSSLFVHFLTTARISNDGKPNGTGHAGNFDFAEEGRSLFVPSCHFLGCMEKES
jgi:hypothetical protein